jgi:hypothetical protein
MRKVKTLLCLSARITILSIFISFFSFNSIYAQSQNVNLIGRCGTPGYAYDVYVLENYAYVASGDYGGLRIIDISTPSSPAEVGYCDTPGASVSVYVLGNYAYIADGSDGLRIINISNTSFPTEIGYYDTPGWAVGVDVLNNYAYVSDFSAGLRIIDISTPSLPIEVGYYDTPGHARGVDVSGKYAYVADGYYSGLWIFQYISDVIPPTITNLQPQDGSIINTSTPTISAQVSDEPEGSGINPSSIQMRLDGNLISHSYDSITGLVRYTPTTPLLEGLHTVFLSVSDNAGNIASTSWSFTITDEIADTIDTEPTIFSVYFTDGPPSYDGKTSATSGGTTYGEVISPGQVRVIELPNPAGVRVIALADNVKVITCEDKVETTLLNKGDSADIVCSSTTVTANILNLQDVIVKRGQPYTEKRPTIQAKLPAGNTITLGEIEIIVPSTNKKSTLVEVLKSDESVLYTVSLPAYLLTNITIVENPDKSTTVTVISGNVTITDSTGATQTIREGKSVSLDENGVFLVVSPIQMLQNVIDKLEGFKQEIDQADVKKERAYISLIDASIILLKSGVASLEKEHKRAAVVKIMATKIILEVMIQVMEKDKTLPQDLRISWTEKCNTIISELTSIIKIIMPKAREDETLEKEAEEEANKYLKELKLDEIETQDGINLISCYTYPNPYRGTAESARAKEQTGIKFRYKATGDIKKVVIEIYNIKGKLIERFEDTTIDGEANYDFAEKLANGVYIYRITISDGKKNVSKRGKIVILR